MCSTCTYWPDTPYHYNQLFCVFLLHFSILLSLWVLYQEDLFWYYENNLTKHKKMCLKRFFHDWCPHCGVGDIPHFSSLHIYWNPTWRSISIGTLDNMWLSYENLYIVVRYTSVSRCLLLYTVRALTWICNLTQVTSKHQYLYKC